MRTVIVIAHNIRSAHNVGSLFRTCDGLGVSKLILSGYTPYPKIVADTRLPHHVTKISDQIHKTALGAENTVPFEYIELPPISRYKSSGYTIIGLEQSVGSLPLSSFEAPEKLVLLLGEERYGITPELIAICDTLIEIPMRGKKESFNVSVAAGIALYALLYR